MHLHEYHCKDLLERYNIPVPRRRIANSAHNARIFAQQFHKPVAIKSQVLAPRAIKLQNSKVAFNPDDAESIADHFLGDTVNGATITKVLVEEFVEATQSLYLSISVDRDIKLPVLTATHKMYNGNPHPEKQARLAIDPLTGLLPFQARNIAFELGFEGRLIKRFVRIATALYTLFQKNDVLHVEINPLTITADNQLIALDARIDIDENALFRHPTLADMRDSYAEDPVEREARVNGMNFVRLEGDIGIVVNGAGLAMTTMDILQHYGGKPANFLDIGEEVRPEKLGRAVKLAISSNPVKVILFNIFDGLGQCDDLTGKINRAFKDIQTSVPIVMRVVGGNNHQPPQSSEDKIGRACTRSLNDAAQQAVQIAGGKVLYEHLS